MSSNGEKEIESDLENELGSESVFRNVYDSMKQSIAIIKLLYDSDGRANDFVYLAVNHAHEKLTGRRAEEFVGKRVSEAKSTVEQVWFERYQEVVRTQKAMSFDDYNADFDMWFRTSASPLPKKDCVAVVAEDITAVKRSEEALKGSEEKYRSIIESMDESLALCEAVRDSSGRMIDYRWLEVNGAQEILMKLSRSEMVG
jgi:PAS domain S-box-containing protein